VAIKPGKPTVFGIRRGKMVFGVPGNPVSTFVIFEMLIKPLLFRMMGHAYRMEMMKGVLTGDFRRSKTERAAIVPVEYRSGEVKLLPYHGSAHIHALCRANGLVHIPRGVGEISAGSGIDVRPI
jgi:molybdopterin molybdotransferase